MWSDEQVAQFERDGFLFSPGLLADEIEQLRTETDRLADTDNDGVHRVRERSGALRSMFRVHQHSDPFKALVRHRHLSGPVAQALGEDSYIFHSKTNFKDAFHGTVWLWHQDYGYWAWDGVPRPDMISVMVFLDRATVHNGCFMVVAGSHKWERQEHYADEATTSYKQWCVDPAVLQSRLDERDIRQMTGEAGDVLFFHCNLVHGSGHNMSPLPRRVFIAVYNSISNKPTAVENPRPDWVVSRDYTVVQTSR